MTKPNLSKYVQLLKKAITLLESEGPNGFAAASSRGWSSSRASSESERHRWRMDNATPGNAPKRPDPIMRFFKFAHLPDGKPKQVSALFSDLATKLTDENSEHFIPGSAERTVALRKLLEGKDAAVRAALPEEGA